MTKVSLSASTSLLVNVTIFNSTARTINSCINLSYYFKSIDYIYDYTRFIVDSCVSRHIGYNLVVKMNEI